MSDLKSDPLNRIFEYVMGLSRTGDPTLALASELCRLGFRLNMLTGNRSMSRTNLI